MNEIFTILTDIEIIFFDLLLYTMLFTLKRDTKIMRTVMYAGCALIISAYFAAVYIMKFPASVSSALCMSIPSFFLFFLLSKYKGSRFILTFCFVDTVSLIIAFIGR